MWAGNGSMRNTPTTRALPASGWRRGALAPPPQCPPPPPRRSAPGAAAIGGAQPDSRPVSPLSGVLRRKLQRSPGLHGGIAAQAGKELPCPLAVLPRMAVKPVVVAARARGHPDLVQRFLQIDDDLA